MPPNTSHPAHFLKLFQTQGTRCEQEQIATFLDIQTVQFSALSAKVREAIDRLKEFRTALISAAVTGKIDVREAVPR